MKHFPESFRFFNQTNRVFFRVLILILAVACAFFGCHKEKEPDPLAFVPDDVPIYTRGKLVDKSRSDLGFQIQLNTFTGEDEVIDWYSRRLKRNGWKVDGQIEGNPKSIVAHKINRTLTISVQNPGLEERQIIIINYMSRF